MTALATLFDACFHRLTDSPRHSARAGMVASAAHDDRTTNRAQPPHELIASASTQSRKKLASFRPILPGREAATIPQPRAPSPHFCPPTPPQHTDTKAHRMKLASFRQNRPPAYTC